MATQSATWAYREAHDDFARTYFRRFSDCVVSSIGMGTYLGDPTNEQDDRYRQAVEDALRSGINVLDTAMASPTTRSERW
jgi:aryl-alcohol dehydrogenase-like predicted oxidoreductase